MHIERALTLFLASWLIALPVSGSTELGGIAKIAAGGSHTCAVTTAGRVACWGNNDYGQLGDTSRTLRLTPVYVRGLNGAASAVTAGYEHSCALTASGGVKCWGRNDKGQVGDGSRTDRLVAVYVSGLTSGVSAIAAGEHHTCALTTGGAVKCWGYNGYGELGDNSQSDRITPVDVSGLANVISISAGVFHTCAITVGGGAKCWGWNGYGQLGDNSTSDRAAPVNVTVLGTAVTAIAPGWGHTCALTNAGAVTCWGNNSFMQLGDNSLSSPLTPVGLGSGVAAIGGDWNHSCAVTTTGAVKCWGENGLGELGDNSFAPRFAPVDVSGLASGIAAIAVGQHHGCALDATGTVKCWGANGFGQLGDGSQTNRLAPTDVPGLSSGIAAIAAGWNHTCALGTTGGLRCWGQGYNGQLGDGSFVDRLTPVNVVGLASGVAAVTAGQGHTCAVTTAGGAKCWGWNGNGQLGNGSTAGSATPVDVAGLGSGVTAISAGLVHTCALTAAGGVKCWGDNTFGQLGDGTTIPRVAPVVVPALTSGVVSIAAGSRHTCALTTAGGVKCWGHLTTGPSLAPIDVPGNTSGVAAIAAAEHSCLLTTAGGVKCWGWNTFGEVGDGTNGERDLPFDIPELANQVAAIGAGGFHSCALVQGGAMKCWGFNGSGGLGDGSNTNRSTPVDVLLSGRGVVAMALGLAHTCALTATGGVKCWGDNVDGQIGDGTPAGRPYPAAVLGSAFDIPHLAGISTRAQVSPGDGVMIGGFIIEGTSPKTVVIRTRGSSLGVLNALDDPKMTIVPAAGGPALVNDDWQTAANAADLEASGLQPFTAKESGLLATLAPGAYTAIVSGPTTGIALVEVYEVDRPEFPLIGISTRGIVQAGDNVMIGGFFIEGTGPQTVVIRARGPSLEVAGALADPLLTVVPVFGGPALVNDDWQTDVNAAALAASGYAPAHPKESALLVTLDPGAYTAIVSGAGRAAGIAIVEIYDAP